ncbi:Aste57867_5626 [Aphanomyces stellatus]|uniref:Aste57867_5626 protein n=1 Tax=Aphanomyces stellatus TaxID=120398 RepID=A0A485KDN9_9STRA|nr:hypothetical protein As57867_005613 [Aphanomyces stellatus]VFT82672.1 Aste57867_5626 [Aphanomyces stellatus]
MLAIHSPSFPSASCRDMWSLWFKGDKASRDSRPLCKLRTADIPDDASKRTWWSTKQLMTKLTQVALRHQLLSSTEFLANMADESFRLLFGQVFQAFLNECGANCTLTGESNCVEAAEWVAQSFPSSTTANPVSQTTRHLPEFPSLACDDMWRLWFKGDDLTDNVPYRRAAWSTMAQPRYDTTMIMTTLTTIAINAALAPSADALEAMPTRDLKRVFDQTFPRFARRMDPTGQANVIPKRKCTGIRRSMSKK